MNLRYLPQATEHTCAAACVRMAFEPYGISLTEKQAARILRTNESTGVFHKKFPIAAEKYKLAYFVHRNTRFEELAELLNQGFIVITCYYYAPEKTGHYVIVERIDEKRVYLLDPRFGPKKSFSKDYFRKIWHGAYDREKGWIFALRPSKNRALSLRQTSALVPKFPISH